VQERSDREQKRCRDSAKRSQLPPLQRQVFRGSQSQAKSSQGYKTSDKSVNSNVFFEYGHTGSQIRNSSGVR
jgi:hypothetical protein